MTAGPFRRIAVVGCGLIGGSFALASREMVQTVTAWDRDAQVRARARDLDVADEVSETLAGAVADAELVLLAVPVAATADVAAQVAAALDGAAGPRPILTDVGSVKARPVHDVEALDLAGIRFVGGHPMAGSERSGVDASDGTLFQGATWVLTPTGNSDLEAFNALGAHLRAVGARVLAVAPELHDRLVAVASHLPQTLATTLMAQAAATARSTGDAVLSVAAGGFRDVTRIAASDPDLWVGILQENREAVLGALDAFAARLLDLRDALDAGDGEVLRRTLAEAQTARRTLPTKERAGALVDLVVPLADQPGMLATVTTALGEAGVNVEDLSMRHATEGARGALLVAVSDADAERAATVLSARGFPSHLEPRTSR